MGSVYGPLPSRRLGQSLGVDPIPFKTCNYNCVYCQLGRTQPLRNTRKDYLAPAKILSEVGAALADQRLGHIDYVTFAGQGDPLLCASLGWLIRGVKAMTDIPVAVITNGSLLSVPEVRQELAAADVVMPSLDAADPEVFDRINRPWPQLKIGEIIDGIAAFRAKFKGQVWVEVMLIKGLNDGEPELFALRDALGRIRPNEVHINLPVRPPAESWVEPPDEEGLLRAIAILGETATVVGPFAGTFTLSSDLSIPKAILEIIRRHPMRWEDIVAGMPDQDPSVIELALTELVASHQAQRIAYGGQVFWRYVDREADLLALWRLAERPRE